MKFIFESYEFDRATWRAKFNYALGDYKFSESISFAKPENFRENFDEKLLDSALFLTHVLVGASYYKTFPTREIAIKSGAIDARQAEFFNRTFQEGLSQFAYENELTRENLADFSGAVARNNPDSATNKSVQNSKLQDVSNLEPDDVRDFATIYNYLKIEDKLPENPDAIIIGGSGTRDDQAERAAEIWHYYAKKNREIPVVASGFFHRDFDRGEVEVLIAKLRELGVSEKCIYEESNSKNSGENIQFSAKLLAENGIKNPREIILTHIPYMTRKFKATAEKQWPFESKPEFFATSIDVDFANYRAIEQSRGQVVAVRTLPSILHDFRAVCDFAKTGFGVIQDVPREVMAAYERLIGRGFSLRDVESWRASQAETARDYAGEGILALQSGGKDSLLVAEMLRENADEFSTLYFSSRKSEQNYPRILDELNATLNVATRKIDHQNLAKAAESGALNGHVPITYILMSLAVVQAILLNKNQILTAVAHEGEEPREMIDDLPINHQWSKTWAAEQDFQDYVAHYISPQILVGSPLRQYSELAVAELFATKCWAKFSRKFSSCNVANYQQGNNNSELKWCGKCAKCANSWLLFAPFVSAEELCATFGVAQDLFADQDLTETFKGLLGIDGVPKPFECVGEIAELRLAYYKARANGFAKLPFAVPESRFDYHAKYAHNPDLAIS
jgi:uncharacterized SAM-binding protein YcdF (DUF218 family)